MTILKLFLIQKYTSIDLILLTYLEQRFSLTFTFLLSIFWISTQVVSVVFYITTTFKLKEEFFITFSRVSYQSVCSRWCWSGWSFRSLSSPASLERNSRRSHRTKKIKTKNIRPVLNRFHADGTRKLNLGLNVYGRQTHTQLVVKQIECQ